MDNSANTLICTGQRLAQVQSKELELLKYFIDICKRLRLNYYLVCGSALGAVKYKGFIPWDDDIDVGMFREDYEVFLQKAPGLLPDNIFLQNFKSDPMVPFIFSKLRNSKTAFIEKASAKLLINQGIFIDIFPLDGYPHGRFARAWFEIRKKYYQYLLYTVLDIPRKLHARILDRLLKMFGCGKKVNRVTFRYSKLISKYSTKDSEIICNHGNWQGKLEYAPKVQYGDGLWKTFEGLDVRVPEDYDSYLSQKYGDWRCELPANQQVSHHEYVVLDAAHSYKEYRRGGEKMGG